MNFFMEHRSYLQPSCTIPALHACIACSACTCTACIACSACIACISFEMCPHFCFVMIVAYLRERKVFFLPLFSFWITLQFEKVLSFSNEESGKRGEQEGYVGMRSELQNKFTTAKHRIQILALISLKRGSSYGARWLQYVLLSDSWQYRNM